MMRVPVVSGVIRRRILINYRVDPDVVRKHLPTRFRPKLAHGWAVGGICLIRLEAIRPKSMPAMVGVSSENAAHRIAVEWDDVDGVQEGVFIPRRDTDSFVNHLAGGRIFSGEYHLAHFDVHENDARIDLAMRSTDGVGVVVKARPSEELPASSIFASIDEASAFFEKGSVGYSTRNSGDTLDAIRLDVARWHVDPLSVDEVHSSYFDDTSLFPEGTAVFDSALLMRDVAHEWHTLAA